jgi:heat shock protein beta
MKSHFLIILIILGIFLQTTHQEEVASQNESEPEPQTKKGSQSGSPSIEDNLNNLVDGFTTEEREVLDNTSEKFSFNADITRLMDIIINSLYTHKEVFIREMISNSSDACDKARFMAVQNPDFLGEKKDLEIRLETDEDAKTISIIDTGVGMTKNDLIKNLGTIAKSGTTSFIEAISKGNSLNLIGQFGVGFYSTYLVSNKVVVTSKNSEDNQNVWVSTAGSYFTVSEDPRGDTLGRGTRVTLFLKEDAQEFTKTDVIRKNIKKYSEFINYPIYLRVNKTYTRQEDIEEEEKKEEPEKKEEEKKEDDLEIKEDTKEKTEEKKEKKKRTITEWKWEWELINENKPLWLRDKKEITKEEYFKFYKALTKDTEDPLVHEHGRTEGEVNFKYILYIPAKKPYDLFDNYYGKNSALKLYVRRVLVNEQFEELIPRYLNFIKGVVDSDDLPLNVSREQLQQHKMIKVMSKRLVRTGIQMMIKMAVETGSDEDDEDEDEEEEEEKKEEKKDEEKKKSDSKFIKFYESFGKNIKLGVIEDAPNRPKLAKLLRFYSTKNPKELISLEQYVKNMKPKQELIYFIAGEEKEVLFKSPLIQKLLEREIEVLLLDDPIDEFCVQNLGEYEKKKLKNVAKGDLKLWDEDEELEKKREKAISAKFKILTDWYKRTLGNKVDKVIVSKRLTDTPCIVVSSEHGYSASMERIQKAQAFANQDKASSGYLSGKKTLELNPSHPSIKALRESIENNETATKDVEDTAILLFESALLESGYSITDPHQFAARMDRVLKFNLNLDRYEKSSPFEVELEEDKPAPTEEKKEQEQGRTEDL